MIPGIRLLKPQEIQRMMQAIDCDRPLVIYLGEWLAALNLFSDAQIYAILNWAKSGICEYDETEKPQKVVLVVSDYRWISCSSCDGLFFDAETFERIPELTRRPITHIVCDVVQLRERWREFQEKERANANRKQPASSADQECEQSA